MSELRTELEYGLLDVVKKAVEGGAKNFDDLDAEVREIILHGSIELADAVASIQGFNANEAQKTVHKYWLLVQCSYCNAQHAYNLRNGIKMVCPSCKRRTDSFSFNHARMATWISKNYKFANGIETDTLYVYNEETGTYEQHAEAVIQHELETVAHDSVRQRDITEAINHIKNANMIHIDRLSGAIKEMQDGDILINVSNGVYSLNQRKLLPHDPKYYFIKHIPTAYDPDARCPQVIKFLRSCFEGDYKPMLSVIENGAYILSPTLHLGRAGLLQGTGGNGKGTWLRLLIEIFGNDNIKGMSLQQLSNRPFATASLYGALANIGIEIPDAKIWDTSIFKALTTQDSYLSAEFKGKPMFSFPNTAKLFFSVNHKPKANDASDAYFDRWFQSVWRKRFRDTPYEDKDLPKKLSTPGERSGLLGLFLTVLPYLMQLSNFTYGQDLETATDMYLTNADSVQAFIKDCVISAPPGTDVSSVEGLIEDTIIRPNGNLVIPKDDVRALYKKYCGDRRLIVEEDKNIWTGLKDSFPNYDDGKFTKDNITTHFVIGIRLRETRKTAVDETPNDSYDDVINKYVETVNSLLFSKGMQGLQGLPSFFFYVANNPDERTIIEVGEMPAMPSTSTAIYSNNMLVSAYDATNISLQLQKTLSIPSNLSTLQGSFTTGVVEFKTNGRLSSFENALDPTLQGLFIHTSTPSVSVTTLPLGNEASPNGDGAGSPQEGKPPGQPINECTNCHKKNCTLIDDSYSNTPRKVCLDCYNARAHANDGDVYAE